jgi:hypothetical protein
MATGLADFWQQAVLTETLTQCLAQGESFGSIARKIAKLAHQEKDPSDLQAILPFCSTALFAADTLSVLTPALQPSRRRL